MIKLDIAERYAKVLFKLDLEKDSFENRIWDFENMLTVMQENPKLSNFLKSPQITENDKKQLLEDSLSPTFDSDFIQYLLYLMHKNRFDYLEPIAAKYRDLVNEHLGIWDADLIVAVPMDPGLESKLIAKLERTFQKIININRKIQPDIIGGSVLIVSNHMVDWSITGRLKHMKESLLERKK